MFRVFRKKKKQQQKSEPAKSAERKEPAGGKQETGPEQRLDEIARKSAEELCGITPDMDREKIRETLALLFRRHNRAASSLDENLRAEAEIMLDAIVEVRTRYLG